MFRGHSDEYLSSPFPPTLKLALVVVWLVNSQDIQLCSCIVIGFFEVVEGAAEILGFVNLENRTVKPIAVERKHWQDPSSLLFRKSLDCKLLEKNSQTHNCGEEVLTASFIHSIWFWLGIIVFRSFCSSRGGLSGESRSRILIFWASRQPNLYWNLPNNVRESCHPLLTELLAQRLYELFSSEFRVVLFDFPLMTHPSWLCDHSAPGVVTSSVYFKEVDHRRG